MLVDVVANDTDGDGDELLATANTNGAHGTVTCDLGGCTYTPEPEYFGSDSFTYTVTDGFGGADIGNVSVTIDPSPITAVLTPATPTVGPGATSIQLADIPYERMRELDVDVSNAPFLKRAPFHEAVSVLETAFCALATDLAPFLKRAPLAATPTV